MDQPESESENAQRISGQLEDEQEPPDVSLESETEKKTNGQMDELTIATYQTHGDRISPKTPTLKEGEGGKRTLTLPEEYLSPSGQCNTDQMDDEEEDNLQWSIRFQPDIDTLVIGDSYLGAAPVNASTPAVTVKPGCLDLPTKATADLISKLYGEERDREEDAGIQSDNERRLVHSLSDIPAELQSKNPLSLAEEEGRDDDVEAELPFETPLKKTENSLDISATTEETNAEDYMPLEDRIKLLGIDLDRPPAEPGDLGLESKVEGEEMPFTDYLLNDIEPMQQQEQVAVTTDLLEDKSSEDTEVISRTRYAGDGGDNLTLPPQSYLLNKSGAIESFSLTQAGSSSRSTDILFSTGELSLTSLEVASIMSNAVKEDSRDWRKERSAAEGGVTTETSRPIRNQDALDSCNIKVALQMEGPDLRVGVGQESLADRGGYSDALTEAGDLQFTSAVGHYSMRRENEEFDVEFDRNMDGESREIIGGIFTNRGDGQESAGNALNDSLNFLSDEDDDDQANEGILSGRSEDLVNREKMDVVSAHSGINSAEDRWVLERSISGSSGSDNQDNVNTSASKSLLSNSSVSESHVQSNNNASGISPVTTENRVGPAEVVNTIGTSREEVLSSANRTLTEGEQPVVTLQSVSEHDTSKDESIPSLVADEDGAAAAARLIETDADSEVAKNSRGPASNEMQSSLPVVDDRAVSPASSTSNTVDTLDLDVRQILHKYGKTLTDEDTEDERKSTGSMTQSEKDRNLRMRVKKLLGTSSHNTDSETNSDLPSDSEWTNKVPTESSTDGESETERKVASTYSVKQSDAFLSQDGNRGDGDLKLQDLKVPGDEGVAEKDRASVLTARTLSENRIPQSWTSSNDIKLGAEGHSLEIPSRSGASSSRSSQSGSINYEYLQKELDEIQHGLAELQKYDMSKGQHSGTAVSSSNSLRIGDSDRESEIGTPRKYSWDYSADLGVDYSAEGRFMTRRRKYEENMDQLAFVESQSSAGSVTPTPSINNDQEHRQTPFVSRSQHLPMRRLFPPEETVSNSHGDVDGQSSAYRPGEIFRTGLLPSQNVTAARKVLARFAEEEKQRKKRLMERDVNAASATRLMPQIDQELHAADRVQEMMQRDSPAKQAYDFLDKADQERHLLEMRQYIHAQIREAATPLRSELKSSLEPQLSTHEPLSAIGAMRNFLSSQLVKTAQENFDNSFNANDPEVRQDQGDNSGWSPRQSEGSRDTATPVHDPESRLSKYGHVRGKSPKSTYFGYKKTRSARHQKYQSSDSDTEGDRTVVSRNSTTDEDVAHAAVPTGTLHVRSGSSRSLQEESLQEKKFEPIPSVPITDQPEKKNLPSGDSRSLQNGSQNLLSRPSQFENHLLHTHDYISSTYDFSAAKNNFISMSQVSRSEGDLRKAHYESDHISRNAAKMNLVGAWQSSHSSPQSLPDSSKSQPDTSKSPLESSRSPYESSKSPPDSSRSPHESSRSPHDPYSPPINSSRSPHNSSRSSSVTPTNLRPYRPPGSNQVYYVESDMDDGSVSLTTMESTHIGSDDARGPEFHPSVYGSRQDPPVPMVGIYHKKKSPRSTSPTRGEPPKVLDPIQENVSLVEQKGLSENNGHRTDEDKYKRRDAEHINNNSNSHDQLDAQNHPSDQPNQPGASKADKGTSYSLSDMKLDSGGHKENLRTSAVSENTAYLGTRNDPSIFRTPKRAGSQSGTPARISSASEYTVPVQQSDYPSGRFDSLRDRDTVDIDSYARLQQRLGTASGSSVVPGPSEVSKTQYTEGRHSVGNFTPTRSVDHDHRYQTREAWPETYGNFKPLQPDLDPSNSPQAQRSVRHQNFVRKEEWLQHCTSDGSASYKHSQPVQNESADLRYQRLEESKASPGTSEAKKSRQPWSPSPIALRHQEMDSQDDIRRSTESRSGRHNDDTWESDLPADINDMWERFKQSSLFSESEAESVDVDLSRLRNLITNPVRHLVEELRMERKERRQLERQLMENLRNRDRSRKSDGKRNESSEKPHRRESDLTQHFETDTSVTSVTPLTYGSEVSDLLESDPSSDVSVSSSTASAFSNTGQKMARKNREDSLQSIPENTTAESAELTTDSDTLIQHSLADSSLAKLKHLIHQQKHQYLKDSRTNEKRLMKIARLENMLVEKAHRKMNNEDLRDVLTDNSTMSEGNFVDDDVHHKKERSLQPSGSPSRSKGESSRSKRTPSNASVSSPSRSKERLRSKHELSSPRSQTTSDKSGGTQSRTTGHKSKSPAKRGKESPSRSKSPAKSPSKSKKTKKPEEDVPLMELRQVRYDNDARSPSPKHYSYMEFENPRSSQKKKSSDKRLGHDDENQNSEKKESRRKRSSVKTSERHASQIYDSPQPKDTRSVAVNVPTPISISPPSRRIINEVTMVSEAIQTTPSLRHGKSVKKTRGPFTPDQSELSNISENEVPTEQPSTGVKGPGPSWFVTFENTKPWRQPLRERQQSAGPARASQHFPTIEGSTGPQELPPDPDAGLSDYKKFHTPSYGLSGLSNAKDAISLQEAFRLFRGDVIKASRERQKYVNLKAQERHLQEMNEQERALLFGFQQQFHEPNPFAHPFSDQLHRPRRRFMTKREIKELTRKNYKKLPEVTQKTVQQRRTEDRRANRIRAQIFAKKVQNRLLHRHSAWA